MRFANVELATGNTLGVALEDLYLGYRVSGMTPQMGVPPDEEQRKLYYWPTNGYKQEVADVISYDYLDLPTTGT